MKTISSIEGYEKNMKEIWDIKNNIYEETKCMDLAQFSKYIEHNISSLKERFKDKYLKALNQNF